MFNVEKFAELPALITPERTWRYGELNLAKINPPRTFAAHLNAESVFTLLAALHQGKVICPQNPSAPLKALPKKIPAGIATLLYTSGSTGIPKLAAHTPQNHLASARASSKRIPLGPGDRWRLNLPLYHVSGISILVRCITSGAAITLCDDATHLSAVPSQLPSLTLPPALKVLLVGGAPLIRPYDAFPITLTYGMTEMSSQIITDGETVPGAEWKIAEDGELLVRGPQLFAGYLQDDGTLDYARDEEGWFHTRDLAADRPFRILGRKDRLLISGGENIQPEEIERALLSLPQVETARVEVIPHPKWGERPIAYVKGNLEGLREELEKILPKYKIPDFFIDQESETQSLSQSGRGIDSIDLRS